MVSTRRISLLALVVLVLTGCSGLSEAPTPLPTAVPPDDSPGSWSLAFLQEISLVDMGQGEHMYKFEINCPILVSGRYQDDWVPVVIDEDAWYWRHLCILDYGEYPRVSWRQPVSSRCTRNKGWLLWSRSWVCRKTMLRWRSITAKSYFIGTRKNRSPWILVNPSNHEILISYWFRA